MTTKLDEFSINLPMTSVGSVGVPAYAEPAVDCMANYSLPSDVIPDQHTHINVSIDSTSMVSYDGSAPNACVELVLSVSCHDESTGKMTNRKIIKRLSFDKVKLAAQAEGAAQTQVVEEQEDDPVEVARMMREFREIQRVRAIAGMSESTGSKEANVVFTYEGDDETLTSSITVDNICNVAHARHVFETQHAIKYPEAKIMRATLVGKD